MYDNPYIYEISSRLSFSFLIIDLQYPEWELVKPTEIIQPRPELETPLLLVEDESSMRDLVEVLSKEHSIAVDLEHHDYRSYQGFTCLIQVSESTVI